MTLTGQPDMSLILIAYKMNGNYGLASDRWLMTLYEIRGLPELEQQL